MIDNLTEAITHAREVAKEQKQKANSINNNGYGLEADQLNKQSNCLECANDHEQLASWLTELQERREADRWIPVSERLPEKEGDYLVDCKERHFAIEHFYFSIADRTPYWSGMRKVYAWRPLPEPYESEDN